MGRETLVIPGLHIYTSLYGPVGEVPLGVFALASLRVNPLGKLEPPKMGCIKPFQVHTVSSMPSGRISLQDRARRASLKIGMSRFHPKQGLGFPSSLKEGFAVL